MGKFAPALLQQAANVIKLTGSFSNIIDGVITDPFIRNWLDLLCFLLSGLPADGTIAAEVAFMFADWYAPNHSIIEKYDRSYGGKDKIPAKFSTT